MDNYKFPEYFSSRVPEKRFQGALKDLRVLLTTAEYLAAQIKNVKNEWNVYEAKSIFYELYNVNKIIKELSIKNKFDNSLSSYNTVSVCSLIRVIVDGFIQICYLLQDFGPERNELRKRVWIYKGSYKRFILVEKNGRISDRLLNLYERVNREKNDLLVNSILLEIKGNTDNLKKFLENSDEKLFKKEKILKDYNIIHFEIISYHLSQFVHLTPLGINQSKQENPAEDNNIFTFMATSIQNCNMVFCEIINLFRIHFNLNYNDKYEILYKFYHHYLTSSSIKFDFHFKDALNTKEEKLFIKTITDYNLKNNISLNLNKNTLFYLFSDDLYFLIDEKAEKQFWELRNLTDGIYHLGIPKNKKEIISVFRLSIKNGEIIEVQKFKDDGSVW